MRLHRGGHAHGLCYGHDVGRDRRRGRGLGATADFGEEGDDLVVATIKLENAGVPTAGGLKVHPESGDVAQVPERDEVLRVDSQRGLKGGAGFLEPTGLEEALTVHDQPVHVAGLFAEVFFAQEDRPVNEAGLAVLVGQRREEAPRVLVVALPKVVDAVGCGHAEYSVKGSRGREHPRSNYHSS